MVNNWLNREQKLFQRKRQKEQSRFFHDPSPKKKKPKKYSKERDKDGERRFASDDNIY